MDRLEELVMIVDELGAKGVCSVSGASRVIRIIRTREQLAYIALRALYELERRHTHGSRREVDECLDCAALHWAISHCEGVLVRNLRLGDA
jgi:hypothetical protein